MLYVAGQALTSFLKCRMRLGRHLGHWPLMICCGSGVAQNPGGPGGGAQSQSQPTTASHRTRPPTQQTITAPYPTARLSPPWPHPAGGQARCAPCNRAPGLHRGAAPQDGERTTRVWWGGNKRSGGPTPADGRRTMRGHKPTAGGVCKRGAKGRRRRGTHRAVW